MLTTIAIFNGFIIVLGLSALGTLAAELVTLTPLLTLRFSNLIRAMIDAATVLTLLFGALGMFDKSGLLGILAFALGFVGGAGLLLLPPIGTILIILAILVEEAAPSNRM